MKNSLVWAFDDSYAHKFIVLWPLFHYVVLPNASDGRIEKKNWDDYKAVNVHFAQKIIENYRPGDISKWLKHCCYIDVLRD